MLRRLLASGDEGIDEAGEDEAAVPELRSLLPLSSFSPSCCSPSFSLSSRCSGLFLIETGMNNITENRKIYIYAPFIQMFLETEQGVTECVSPG